MRKIHIGFTVIATILLSSSAFAYHMDSKACRAVVDACKKAGYERGEGANKKFWNDCMKPVLMGKTVKGVMVDPAMGKQCRMDKMIEMKKQMKEFENVPTGN